MSGGEHRERLKMTLGELVVAARELKATGDQHPDGPISLEAWRAKKRVATHASMRFAEAVNLFFVAESIEEKKA